MPGHPETRGPRPPRRFPIRIVFTLNGEETSIDAAEGTPLLWVLRDVRGLTGTKYGCGIGLCGACTVHLDGEAVRSCQVPIESVEQRAILTIEGLSATGQHTLQRAWLELQVPQCGYCQSGQLMSAAALLAKHPRPTARQIDAAMSGNLCRCGTYARIRKAIARAAGGE